MSEPPRRRRSAERDATSIYVYTATTTKKSEKRGKKKRPMKIVFDKSKLEVIRHKPRRVRPRRGYVCQTGEISAENRNYLADSNGRLFFFSYFSERARPPSAHTSRGRRCFYPANKSGPIRSARITRDMCVKRTKYFRENRVGRIAYSHRSHAIIETRGSGFSA